MFLNGTNGRKDTISFPLWSAWIFLEYDYRIHKSERLTHETALLNALHCAHAYCDGKTGVDAALMLHPPDG